MKRMTPILPVLMTVGLVIGCNTESPSQPVSQPAASDMHQHPTEGPHHGSLIELGNEEYHAELVHDDTGVTVYILDSSGTKAVPIDAADLVINLVHDSAPMQFKLVATPDSGDSPGKSSRFTLQDTSLVQELDHEHPTARLTVTIDGKSYRGELKHDHEQAHDHEHGDDHGN